MSELLTYGTVGGPGREPRLYPDALDRRRLFLEGGDRPPELEDPHPERDERSAFPEDLLVILRPAQSVILRPSPARWKDLGGERSRILGAMIKNNAGSGRNPRADNGKEAEIVAEVRATRDAYA